MRYEEIEQHLGAELAAAIRDSVQAAYVAAVGAPDAQQKLDALRWHLLVMLSATIVSRGPEHAWLDVATECGHRLASIIDDISLSRNAPRAR